MCFFQAIQFGLIIYIERENPNKSGDRRGKLHGLSAEEVRGGRNNEEKNGKQRRGLGAMVHLLFGPAGAWWSG